MLRQGGRQLFGICEKLLACQLQQSRTLMLQECHGMQLLEKYGVSVPQYGLANTPEEAYDHAHRIGGQDFVIKAQVLAGGRGKGTFDSGLKGGVQIVFDPEQAREKSNLMIGRNLITKQTDERGRRCDQVLVCERLYTRREHYFSITLDRKYQGPVMIGSGKGGVNIEEVAAEDPSAITAIPVDINTGLTREKAIEMSVAMTIHPSCVDQCADNLLKLYELFRDADALLLEVNPLAEDVHGKIYCMDCKLVLDDNAFYRQPHLYQLMDKSQEDPAELRAEKHGLNYVRLFGNIGCMVNGAGLAMATMDIIKLHGGEPANFLDVGGGANEETITEAFDILISDPRVRAILVNIFGGIVRCDVIALGIINAAQELHINIPIICRLMGTNVDEAKTLIAASGLRILPLDNLEEAARLVVKMAEIVDLAQKASIGVHFKLDI